MSTITADTLSEQIIEVKELLQIPHWPEHEKQENLLLHLADLIRFERQWIAADNAECPLHDVMEASV